MQVAAARPRGDPQAPCLPRGSVAGPTVVCLSVNMPEHYYATSCSWSPEAPLEGLIRLLDKIKHHTRAKDPISQVKAGVLGSG